MPCYEPDYRDYERADEINRERRRRREIEAFLCGVMTSIDNLGVRNKVLSNVDWKEVGLSRKQLHRWWSIHKESDEKRKK